ncbi:moronecidin-like [Xiphophorus hellerii]|uniref:moronecidin-like n=1 Tax=Xiphophorus hellerii TaxID=8084 RepID=UPI0013B47300|nr:moronecidin-like [Xiphophorus hellerii]
MKCTTLFLVLSMVVLMAQPGECFIGWIVKGITEAAHHIHHAIQRNRKGAEEQADQQQLDQNQLNRQQLDQDQLDQKDLDQDQQDQEDLDQDQLDQEDLDQDQLDQEDLDQDQLDQEDLDKQQLDKRSYQSARRRFD